MSEPGVQEKVCPYCAETIKAAAIRCRFCQADLVEAATATVGLDKRPILDTAEADTGSPVWQFWKRKRASKDVDEVPLAVVESSGAPGPNPGVEADPAAQPSPKLLAILVGSVIGMLVVTGILLAVRARPPAIPTHGKDAAAVQITSETARDAGLTAATKLTQKALSYKWNTLAKDISAAEAGMTPGFAKQYDDTMAKVKQQTLTNQIVLNATVVATGIVSATDHKFQALAFINQSTTAKGSKNTQLDQSRVVVTLTRGNGDWKISKLDVF